MTVFYREKEEEKRKREKKKTVINTLRGQGRKGWTHEWGGGGEAQSGLRIGQRSPCQVVKKNLARTKPKGEERTDE